ncbi:agmatine deiminase family protein [Olsenella sp. YH-ols2217]|uniref:Putative agmatine deiminase n=1 Tax=Kribbibacterium absianum TaxID=3044210 RepID=A0ABT6ZJV8_9ACTN|nr:MULTISPECIES: agmatine deiminase family protein [unclassified Olsenella]MDJ1122408.1 agmatine deiminase family protein [Olsenella sp. YH-ols2216]MDJ1129338.1 agmatine deiminase family protein [Olsenella sp. YH-ols2217]
MRTITESESTPAADGYAMPAEFAPQDRVWMGWPHRTDTWAHGAKPAQAQYANVARAIAQFTPVYMCANECDYANCKAVFEDDPNVTVVEMSTNDAWFRDTGATFVTNGEGGKRAVHWHFNAYGGAIDGLYAPWDFDEQIAVKMAELAHADCYRPDDMILEGGSITVDGEGTVIVTDQCLLSPGRTASAVREEPDEDDIWPTYANTFQPWSEPLRAYMTEHLKDYLGVEKVIWVKEGIDPCETNGHIDDVATFIAPGAVACIWTDDPDYPFYRQCHEAYETLSNAVDAQGRTLRVHKLPMPVKPVYMDEASCASIDVDENAEPRVPDEPLIASYMNFLVTNGGVITPQYGDENDALAIETLQRIYDEEWGAGAYTVVGVPSEQVVYGGGNIHCITQQEPRA